MGAEQLTKHFMEDQVRRGIALLDDKVEGWRERVSLNELDTNDCDQCVLGQLFGDYYSGKIELHLSSIQAQACGFSVPERLIDYSTLESVEYEALTNTWKALLAA